MPGSIKEMGHNKCQYKKAGNLRAKIVSEIKMGGFVYKKTFPDSKTSPKFDPIQKISTFGELALSWYEIIKVSYLPMRHELTKLQLIFLRD